MGQEFTSPEEAYAVLLSGKDKKASMFALAGGRQENGVWQYSHGVIASKSSSMRHLTANVLEEDAPSGNNGMGYS